MNSSALFGAALWLCAAGAAGAQEAVQHSVCSVPSVLDEAMIRPLETGRSAAIASDGPYGGLVSDPAWFADPKASVVKPSSADLLAR